MESKERRPPRAVDDDLDLAEVNLDSPEPVRIKPSVVVVPAAVNVKAGGGGGGKKRIVNRKVDNKTSSPASSTSTISNTETPQSTPEKRPTGPLDGSAGENSSISSISNSSINDDKKKDAGDAGEFGAGDVLNCIWEILVWLYEATLELIAYLWLQSRIFNHYILTSPTTVFGAAPSLSKMLEINKNAKGTPPFRAPWFWYYFRLYFPYVFPVVILLIMICALTGWNSIEGHLVFGSILSLFGSISVVLSYFSILPWRKHPSTLIVYRAISTVFFSINIIDEARMENKPDSGRFYTCRTYAFFTQFSLLVGEAWLTSIASDLVNSLTNPFSSYQASLKRYLLYTNIFAFVISVIFYNDDNCQGNFSQGICWIKFSSVTSSCLWGYYLVWIMLMYLYQIWAVTFAYFRLKRGLSVTFAIRQQTAEATFKCLMVYAFYLIFVAIFFWTILSSTTSQSMYYFFLFIIANRGSVDALVWFNLSDFQRDDFPFVDDATIHFDKILSSPIKKGVKSIATTFLTVEGLKNLKDTVLESAEEIHNVVATDYDESDLSPQVNLALRKQVIEYVTRGVKDSISRENLQHSPSSDFSAVESMFNSLNPVADPADLPTQAAQMLTFYLDGEHRFRAYAEGHFSALRKYENISDEMYLELMSKPTKERLSEGASGAFMFFCGSNEFIVKTIRDREAKVLHESIERFQDYIKENPKSFLCRFLGSYSLQMYEQTFYFVVMLNCFDPEAKINERYDIKGSWVGRSADPVNMSKKAVCRHCNTYFVPNQYEQCKVIVGYHEPNVVLKDNDLRQRLFLNKVDTERALDTLAKDSDLLGELGVLDYSLIIGVKKHKFDVEISNEMTGLPTREKGGPNDHCVFKSKSVVGSAVFHLGVIDFLQDWTLMKKIERMFKIYILRKDPDGLSVMRPDYYMLRFQKKMDVIFDKNILHEGDGDSDANADQESGEHSSLLVTHFSRKSVKNEMAQIAVRRRSNSTSLKYIALDDADFNPLGGDKDDYSDDHHFELHSGSSHKSSSRGSSGSHQILKTIVEDAGIEEEFDDTASNASTSVRVSFSTPSGGGGGGGGLSGKYQQFDDDAELTSGGSKNESNGPDGDDNV